MFAYGTEECAAASTMVTGPGNIYVAAAKRLLKGRIGIDSEAGPTEIAILADDTADPVHVAADLISQAEHDPLAAAVLVTDCVRAGRRRREGAAEPGRRDQARRADHRGAGRPPVRHRAGRRRRRRARAWSTPTPPSTWRSRPPTPRAVAARVRNAGAIFVGPYAPVSLGDYCAGSNHVLPTGGCACHSSGLSVQTFLRGIHVVDYTPRGAGRGRAAHVVRARRRRGPARARRRGPRPVRLETIRPGDRESDRPDTRRPAAPRRPARPARRTARRSSTCRCGSTPTRTPTRRRRRWSPSSPSAVRAQRGRRSTATPTATPSRCAPDLADYLGHGLTARRSVWAANGSNEILQQILQAFGGPGRTRAGLRAVVLDAPDHHRGTAHRVDRRARASDGLRARPGRGRRRDRGAPARRRVPDLARTTRPAPRCRSDVDRGDRSTAAPGMVVVDEAYAEFARHRHAVGADRCCRGTPRLIVTRTMSKAFAMAGARLGYLAAAPGGGRRAAAGPAAVPPVGAHPGGRAGGARARRRAARHGRRAAGRAGRASSDWLRAHGLRGRRLRRQLRAVRPVRRPAAVWQGAARPRRADPRRRPAGLAAGLARHRRRRWTAFLRRALDASAA